MRLRDLLRRRDHSAGARPGAADTARFARTARERPGWDARNEMMSRLVRPGETVWDFGAGARTLREMIPADCTYVPIDCVASDPSVFVQDYNLGFALPPGRPDCLYMSGFLEYLDDPLGFLDALRRALPPTFAILSYAWEIADPVQRRRGGWRNHLGDLAATMAALGRHLDHLREAGSHGRPGARQAILTGRTRPAP